MSLATVDLSRINDNYSCLSKGKSLFAVVKSDAYGHGLSRVADTLYAAGARQLAVSDGADALYLAKICPMADILLLVPPPRELLLPLLSAGVILPVADPLFAEAVAVSARGMRRAARVHLVLNSGMSRLGFSLSEADFVTTLSLLLRLLSIPEIHVEGAFTHLAEPPDAPRTQLQLLRFFSAAEELYRRDASLLFHFAATPMLSYRLPPELPPMRFAARVGLSLYGFGTEGVRPAMTVEARVTGRYLIRRGERVGYGDTKPLPVTTETAVVDIGYADGLPRLSEGAFFLDENGSRLPILGRVSMNQTVLAVGDSALSVGDRVTALDPNGIIMSSLVRASGAIPYELLLMGNRMSRRYLS